MDDARLTRLVRQHAQTSRLMGVDFVPAFRRGEDGHADVAEARPAAVAPTANADAPAPAAPKAEVAHTPKPAAQSLEAKPAPRAPTPAAPVISEPVAAKRPDAGAPRDPVKTQAALNQLRARYEQDAPHKQFVTAHTRIVFGEGDPCARIVFVGEAPGEEEDRTGRPFVGRSGELLTRMITGMGLSREQVYICNVMKTRPPDNATPTATEIAICEPYLREQLAIIAPEAIVTLGLPAARALLHTQESMTKMRGRWRTYELAPGHVVPLMPTFHPAYVLRNYTDETRGQVWSDLCQVLDKLGMPKPAKAK